MKWTWIKGYKGLYKISSTGLVKSVDRIVNRPYNSTGVLKGRIMRQFKIGRYRYVTLTKNRKPKNFLVHRLVLEAFVGPCPPGMEARHFPDKTSNKLSNLSWAEKSVNMSDKRKQGAYDIPNWNKTKGEQNPNCKVSDETVRRIIKIGKSKKLTAVDIANITGLHPSTVRGMIQGIKRPYLK